AARDPRCGRDALQRRHAVPPRGGGRHLMDVRSIYGDYDLVDAAWGGDYYHIGIWESPGEPQRAAAERANERLAERAAFRPGEVVREAFRVLKPGGRVAVSDLTTAAPMPPDVEAEFLAVQSIPGFWSADRYARAFETAGFAELAVEDWTEQGEPSLRRVLENLQSERRGPVGDSIDRLQHWVDGYRE